MNYYLLGTTLISEETSPCALSVLLVLNKYQMLKKYFENQTLRITCKSRFPIKCLDYMLGILCRSWVHSRMNFKGRYHQSSIPARVLLPSIVTQKENLNQPEQVHLLPNECSTESILRKYRSLRARPASAMPKNHENWRTSNVFPKIILKNRYHQTCIPQESEWKTAFKAL